jgi:DNA polymerase elongation subunit (family B)
MEWMLMVKEKSIVLDIETTGSVLAGKCVLIGCYNLLNGEMKTFYDDREDVLIKKFLDYFHTFDFQNVIGYNIYWDLRYLYAKCLKYNIKISTKDIHVNDLMLILKNPVNDQFNYNKVHKLNDWSRLILGEEKILKKGSVGTLYSEGRLLELIEYNRQDVHLALELWKRITEVEGVKNVGKAR